MKARAVPVQDGSEWLLWLFGVVAACLAALISTEPERLRVKELIQGTRDRHDDDLQGTFPMQNLGLAHAVGLVVAASTVYPLAHLLARPFFTRPPLGHLSPSLARSHSLLTDPACSRPASGWRAKASSLSRAAGDCGLAAHW